MNNRYKSVLINIDEIWLKGKNRRWYTDKLRNQILHSMKAYHEAPLKLTQEGPKFFITSETAFSDNSLQALVRVAGIRSIQPALLVENDLDAIKAAALEESAALIKQINNESDRPTLFRVESKRGNKSFPMNSMELSREVGAHLLINLGNLKVRMKNPELTVSIRVLSHCTFVATKKIEGLSGLPIPTSGKAVTLLSGGFDSPVAAYLMFRRGLEQIMVFFHAYPYVGVEVTEKVRKLCSLIARYQAKTRLLIIPFGEIQKRIGEECKEDYRTLLFRQYMVRVAEQIALKEKAKALITGDSLSQVSSQTMDNLSIVDQSCALPILRPLIGFNKSEIIDLSRKIGTHDVSKVPHDDACTMFAPKHPVIRGSKVYTDGFFVKYPMIEEIQRAVETAKTIKFNVKGEEVTPPPTSDQQGDPLGDPLFDFSTI